MIFKDRIIDIINILENKGVVCMPDDHRWNLAILPAYYESSIDVKHIHKYTEEIPTIIYENLDQLKMGLPSLHPRIDTMLTYYKRSFLMVCKSEKVMDIPRIADTYHLSIARNEYLSTILSLLNQPLILWPIHKNLFLENVVSEQVRSVSDFICTETDYIDQSQNYVTFSVNEEGILLEA